MGFGDIFSDSMKEYGENFKSIISAMGVFYAIPYLIAGIVIYFLMAPYVFEGMKDQEIFKVIFVNNPGIGFSVVGITVVLVQLLPFSGRAVTSAQVWPKREMPSPLIVPPFLQVFFLSNILSRILFFP